MSPGDSYKVHFIYWSLVPLVSQPCVNFLNRFHTSTLTAVGSWLNENKEDATTIRDWHHQKRRTETSWHLPSSTDNTVAIRSQFLFNKPLKCAPRPPALPIPSMSDFLGRRGGIATMAPVQTRNPGSVSHAADAAEGWSSVATHRRMRPSGSEGAQWPFPHSR